MAPLYESVVFICACLVLVNGASPPVYYLDEECSDSVKVTGDMRLKLTYYSSSHLHYSWKCSATVKTTVSRGRLLVQYRSLNTLWSNNCRRNNLKIIDSDKSTILNGRYGDCGGFPRASTYNSSGSSITFKFQTDNSVTPQYGQFDILITSFSTGYNNSCPNGGYHCDNNRCINSMLVCNGYNDCGDGSDETCDLPAGAVAGIVIAVILCIALCIIVYVIQSRRRRRYRRLCEAKPYDAYQTTTTIYPAPSVYSNVQNPYLQPSYQTYGQ